MRGRQQLGRLAATLILGAALAVPGRSGAQVSPAQLDQQARPLRVCADPDDLPFSSAKPDKPGVYIELGQQIAQSIGRPFQPLWALSYFGKRTVRTTLLARQCDAYVGLPGIKGFMGPQLVYSKPFLHIGYAIMAPAGMHITRLDDLLGKRVAVQFSTPPQILLAARDDIHAVTFLNPEEAVRALGRHEVDVAFVWGPTAGYLNMSEFHSAYWVTPVAGDGMQYPVKIGFARADMDLRDQVDRALDESVPTVDGLISRYGLPTAVPVTLGRSDASAPPTIILAETSETVPATVQPGIAPAPAEPAQPATATAQPVLAPASTEPSASQPYDGDTIEAGHKIFNGTCSHCHGPDAVQSVKRIDLRLLHHRYGDSTATVFHETVTKGRPAKGMPNWSKVFSEEDFTKIYAYLSTIQTD
jgi:ABC-type amino acid transport substrate-binding protein/mono/diheme cytochrome c family protein